MYKKLKFSRAALAKAARVSYTMLEFTARKTNGLGVEPRGVR
jgi:hypothetical protein